MLKNYAIVCLFGLIVVLAGCSSKMDLTYEPTIEKKASNHINLLVQPIGEDDCYFATPGKLKGSRTGEVKCDLLTFAHNAFQSELTNAGYLTLDGREQTQQAVSVNMSGNHSTTYLVCHGPLSQKDGHLNIKISVKKGNREIFSKVYAAHQPMSFPLYKLLFGLQSRARKFSQRSFREISSQFIEDLNAALIPLDTLNPSTHEQV